jgi:Zn-dependent M16 (insulinase) family peptidase
MIPIPEMTNVHPDYKFIRSQFIESLNLRLEEYEHKVTRTRHLHLASNYDENVFLVALKTVPRDDTGVAHILEHTTLCGSKRYPVRDPFFMMIRRSLNTFMNAFTSSDWTAYPFASKNKKDFNNLLDVYLDSVFFPILDPNDFAQEGHRLEFEEVDNPDSPLIYKGIVYNEMKGAMSSPTSQLWQKVTRYLFPTTTYHFNSGGEPDAIPDLSYEQLIRFHKKHYHPSNAVFMTFGNIPAIEHHVKIQEQVLSKFEWLDHGIQIKDERRYFAPIRVEDAYAVPSNEPIEAKTHIVIAWLLGHSSSLEEKLEAHILSELLLENSASPLQRALEKTDIGHSPSPLCGLEDSNREMAFICGIEGGEPGREKDLELLVNSVFDTILKDGVEHERLEAILHQLELGQREISGDSYPYGLQLILSSLSPLIHGGDPFKQLDLTPVLDNLREKIKTPNYAESLVKQHLVDNVHRVTLTLRPDQSLELVREQLMQAKLKQIKDALSEEQKQALIVQAHQLEQRQNKEDDASILPKVGLDDIPEDLVLPISNKLTDSPLVTIYEKGTNGLVYLQLILEIPALSQDELSYLPLYTQCITELGCGDLSYLEMQDKLSLLTGGISCYSSIKGGIDNEQSLLSHIVLSGKGLARNAKSMASLMSDFFYHVRFDESERIRELIAHIRSRREHSVTNNGHALAMGAASSKMSPAAWLSYQLAGLEGIKYLKKLDDSLKDEATMQNLLSKLQDIHEKVRNMPAEFLVIAEKDQVTNTIKSIRSLWKTQPTDNKNRLTQKTIRDQVKEAWITSTQVNFCAKSYPTVPIEHPDAAPLTVLGGFLRNGFLHRAIREQGGAYGGGASQDSGIAAFRFYSYRDPRLADTLTDFDKAIEWLVSEDHPFAKLEEAILGVIGSIDKPKSPAGEAKSDFHSQLSGRSQNQRKAFRQRILKVTIEDLKRVATQYLKSENASIAVVTHLGEVSQASDLGLEIKHL